MPDQRRDTHEPPSPSLEHWVASQGANLWAIDIEPGEGPFAGRTSARAIGAIGIGALSTNIAAGWRRRSHVARDGRDCYSLVINTGAAALRMSHVGHEAVMPSGAAVLISGSEPFGLVASAPNACLYFFVPRPLLHAVATDVEARLGLRIDPGAEALILLRRYCRLVAAEPPIRSPELLAHAADTIAGLVGLTAGASGEPALRQRGIRAARLASVLAAIRADFIRPGISAAGVGRDLGLSARYVQDLLAETGTGFAERVLEARLLFAHGLLADRRSDPRRISDIAYAAGFSDISYFNRCFRRRFGCAPGALR